MGRYDSLAILLQDSPVGVVELSFADVDDVVGGLPPSARRYREWWANASSPQGRAWLAAGYRVEILDVTAERVRFAPVMAGRARTSRPGSGKDGRTVTQPPTTGNAHVEVALGWHQLGAVGLGSEGRLQFPKAASIPGRPHLPAHALG